MRSTGGGRAPVGASRFLIRATRSVFLIRFPHTSVSHQLQTKTSMVLSVKCVAPSGSTDPTRWMRNRSAPKYFSPGGGVTAKSFAAERRSPSRLASATIAGSAACSGPERVSNLEKRGRSIPVSHGRCAPRCRGHRFACKFVGAPAFRRQRNGIAAGLVSKRVCTIRVRVDGLDVIGRDLEKPSAVRSSRGCAAPCRGRMR